MEEDFINSLLKKQVKLLKTGLNDDEIIANINYPKPREITMELFATLDIVGCNPMNRKGIKKMYWTFFFGCQIFWFLSFVGFNFCCFLDITEFLEHIMFLAIEMQIIIKFLIGIIYGDNLVDILNILFNVFWKVENLISPAKRIYVAYNILLRKLIKFYKRLFIFSIIIVAIETIYATPGKPVTKVWSPESIDFNNKQPYALGFLVGQLTLIAGCVILTIVPFDSLFIMMTGSAYIQMECLKCTIKNIDCSNRKIAVNTLNKCLKYHNLLLEYLKKIEVIYSISLMSQLSASISTICIAIYLWTISEEFVVRPFLYAMLSSAQLLVYCFGGQMITDQSASLADSAFESNWWMLPDKGFRTGIILIVQRSQRNVHISAGGVYILSMDLFMKILRASVSFMTLLKNSINE